MEGLPVLTILLFLPVIGSILLILMPTHDKDTESLDQNNIFSVAIWISLCSFLFALFILYNLSELKLSNQLDENISWLNINVQNITIKLNYHLYLDNLSLALILLTNFLTLICLVISSNYIKTGNIKIYSISFLLLESALVGSFLAADLILFYLFFEFMLVPMFFIIGIWGGKEKIHASFKFFLYTLLGSLFFLISIIYLIITYGTSDMFAIIANKEITLSSYEQILLSLGFLAAFLIKVPVFPFHTWLTLVHVQAPTAASMMLAGVLIKVGAYGILRFNLPLFPDTIGIFAPYMFTISLIGLIYTSLIAFRQTDVKKLIAYSSVAHMAFVIMGIFSMNAIALNGAIFQIISHGIVSAALFFAIGVIYERTKTREIQDLGGAAIVAPFFVKMLIILTMASLALPGTIGFIGEFLILIGIYKYNILYSFLAAFSVILTPMYMLKFYKAMALGEIHNTDIKNMKILKTENIIMSILAILAIIFGVMPNIILDFTSPFVDLFYHTN